MALLTLRRNLAQPAVMSTVVFLLLAGLLLWSRTSSRSDASPVGSGESRHTAEHGSNDWAAAVMRMPAPVDSDGGYLVQYAAMCPPRRGPRVVIDVGGNKGYSLPRYGLLFGNLDFAMVRDAIGGMTSNKTAMWRDDELEVHVFEPTSSAVSVLRTLISRLPYYRIKLNAVGVSDKVGTATFRVPFQNVGDEGGTMGIVPGRRQEGPIETVPITTLDEYASKQLPPKKGGISYVKSDVEGFDAFVVRGMEGLLRSHRVDAFEFEFSSGWLDGRTGKPQSLGKLTGWLDDLEYACYMIRTNPSGVTGFVRIGGAGYWNAMYGSRKSNRENIFCINIKLACFPRFRSALEITPS